MGQIRGGVGPFLFCTKTLICFRSRSLVFQFRDLMNVIVGRGSCFYSFSKESFFMSGLLFCGLFEQF